MSEVWKYISEVKDRWKTIGQQKNPGELVLEVEFYKKIIETFQVGKSYFFIFSPPLFEIEMVSASVKDVIGYDPEEFSIETMLKIIHPDDFANFVDFENKVVNFKMNLPTEKLMKYKSQYNYRIRKKDGTYLKILQQSLTVQCDDDGAVLRNLVLHTDISDFKTNNEMKLSFIGLEGEPSFLDVQVPKRTINPENPLTKREMEILLLLIKDITTEQIAKKLFISPETVKTHRKNIHAKLETKNSLQLLRIAIEKAWI